MEHLYGTPLWNTFMEHLYGTPLWNTFMEHLYGTPLWKTFSATGFFCNILGILSIFRNSVDKVQVSLKSDNDNGYFT
jgi:hypothetical protein